MRKFWSMLCVCSLLLGVASVIVPSAMAQNAQETDVVYTISTYETEGLAAGDMFEIKVSMDSVEKINQIEFFMAYDATKIKATAATVEGFFCNFPMYSANVNPYNTKLGDSNIGEVWLTGMDMDEGVAPSGDVISTITFKALTDINEDISIYCLQTPIAASTPTSVLVCASVNGGVDVDGDGVVTTTTTTTTTSTTTTATTQPHNPQGWLYESFGENVFSLVPYYGEVNENGKLVLTDQYSESENIVLPTCLWLEDESTPDVYTKYEVAGLGDNLFSSNSNLKSITIPDTVTSIGREALSCSGLQSITVTSGNAVYSSKDGVLFNKAKTEVVTYPRGKQGAYTVPATVKHLGERSFAFCQGLTAITLPKGLVSIGEMAFMGCSFQSITIPDTVTLMEMMSFRYCSQLESIVIPSAVKRIGNQAFSDCTALRSVVISEGVANLDIAAFAGCASLKTITLPSTLTNIVVLTPEVPSYFVKVPFAGCSSLTEIHVAKGNPVYSSIDGVLFNKDQTVLHRFPEGKKGSYIVPSGVKTIGKEAFSACDGLTALAIPRSMTTVKRGALAEAYALTDTYYEGAEAQWKAITVEDNNYPLACATVHYNCSFAKITVQSATAAYAGKDQNASVTVTATGDGLSYTWYVKNPGQTKYSKSSITADTYKAKMTAANSGRLVYCVVKDKYGNEARSKTFVLRMKATVTKETATAAYAKKGAKVSVAIGAAGDGLTYTWYIKNANGTKYSKSSITSATYSATMSDTVKGRRIYCVVKDKYGKTAQTKTFILREAVSITTQPKTTTTAKGAIAKATVKASGDGLTYTWYIKNAGQTKYSKSSITKATYSVVMNNNTKNRLVYCVIKDKYGKSVKSTTVQLKMK